MKYALVSDFDGTISFDDFFYFAFEKYLTKNDLEPWGEYINGNKTHFEALNEIYNKIKAPKDELDEFIKEIKIDDAFFKTFDLCEEKSIPFYIVSAGCDYYIKITLGEMLKKITLITNSGSYSQETGLVLSPQPIDSPYYDKNVGVNKRAVVEELKEKGYSVIFAGDGYPDVEPAMASDVVFARKHLLEECKRLKIKTQNFDSYKRIYDYIKEL